MIARRFTMLARVRGWILPAAGGLILIWAVSTTALGFTVTDATCVSACHAMAPFSAGHAESSHSSVGCTSCHASPGPLGGFAQGVALQRRAVATVRGGTAGGAGWSDGACLGCHAGVRHGVLVSGGIAVRHSDFLDLACTTCHGGVGHRVEGAQYSRVDMDLCLQCHSASALEPQTCGRCHRPEGGARASGVNTWRVTHGKTWRQTHGMGDLSACVACHRPGDCAECHGVALPHPGDWARRHGEGLVGTDAVSCRTCHQEQWCVDCHGVEMPHGEAFLRRHGKDAERVGDACLRCHESGTCDECHFRSAHPDIPGVGRSHGVGG